MNSRDGQQSIPLEELGIEFVEPGLVEDTPENRGKLRIGGYQWTNWTPSMDDADPEMYKDSPPLLQVHDLEHLRKVSLERRNNLGQIMVDPTDPWSDFISPADLPANAPVPIWVRQSGLLWNRALREGVTDPAERGLWLPERCKHVKRDGTRCWLWAGSGVRGHELRRCRIHAAQAAANYDDVVRRARYKIRSMAPSAADKLEELLEAETESVRLRAATEILDRVGIRGGTELSVDATVEIRDVASEVRARLEQLRTTKAEPAPAPALEDVVDADVVSE